MPDFFWYLGHTDEKHHTLWAARPWEDVSVPLAMQKARKTVYLRHTNEKHQALWAARPWREEMKISQVMRTAGNQETVLLRDKKKIEKHQALWAARPWREEMKISQVMRTAGNQETVLPRENTIEKNQALWAARPKRRNEQFQIPPAMQNAPQKSRCT